MCFSPPVRRICTCLALSGGLSAFNFIYFATMCYIFLYFFDFFEFHENLPMFQRKPTQTTYIKVVTKNPY